MNFAVNAPLEIVASALSEAIDIPSGFVDPFHGEAWYADKPGWKLVGSVSSSKFTLIRAFRRDLSLRSMLRGFDSLESSYAPRLIGSLVPSANQTIIEYALKPNPMYYLAFSFSIFFGLAGFVGMLASRFAGNRDPSSYAIPFLLCFGAGMQLLTASLLQRSSRQWYVDFLTRIKHLSEVRAQTAHN